ncbi:MAG: glycosyltransferase [Syntrophobacteraceae bacterium]
MKISGFTIVKNAINLQYPVVESILSILPIVDEYVVLLGDSQDGTLEMLKGIGSEKIRILEDEWHDDFKADGQIFSHLTNIALSKCKGDWAFYLQADEVIHEKDLPALQRLIAKCDKKPAVMAISLRFLHFYGDYQTRNPYMHRKACRIVRNNGQVVSIWDAVAFGMRGAPGRILAGPRKHYVKSNIPVYHYTSVKDPSRLLEKENLIRVHYNGDRVQLADSHHYDLTMMKRFRKSHPKVMEKRIAEFRSPLPPYRSRWLKPEFYSYLLRHGYKG